MNAHYKSTIQRGKSLRGSDANAQSCISVAPAKPERSKFSYSRYVVVGYVQKTSWDPQIPTV